MVEMTIFRKINDTMKILIEQKKARLYLWMALGYFLLGTLSMTGDFPGRFFAVLVNNLWAVVYVTVLNYILFEFTIPFVLAKRRYIIYNVVVGLPLLFIHVMLYSYGAYLWRLLGLQLHVYTALKTYATMDVQLENHMGYSMGAFFLYGIARHIYNYVSLKQTSQLLQIEKQAAELNYLRSQTNPHFLFNTLNNIYSLARDKSDLAPQSILKLSKILRFMLYEAGGEYIAIEQELKIMDDYIALEKLRYDDTLRINFNHNVEDMKQAIPPLLLIPLVENAFKHGVSETRGNPFVDIHLTVNNRQLKFVVKNSTETPGEETVKENIGLSNLRRQLELLYKDYDITLDHGKADFSATLRINLLSHV